MTYILKQFKLYRYRCFELVMVIRILLAMVIKILLVMVLNILFMVIRLTIVVKDFKLIA